jgi:hypothetical protein
MYNQGLDLYQNFACADLNNTINSNGQNSESGRDQGHTQLSLGNMAETCQTAYNQGENYWDLLHSRLKAGYEYTASYNLGNTVDYDPDFYRYAANVIISFPLAKQCRLTYYVLQTGAVLTLSVVRGALSPQQIVVNGGPSTKLHMPTLHR